MSTPEQPATQGRLKLFGPKWGCGHWMYPGENATFLEENYGRVPENATQEKPIRLENHAPPRAA